MPWSGIEILELLGGCRLVVTPLFSKLMTLGVEGCRFNMRNASDGAKHLLAIPYAEPRRYRVELSTPCFKT